MLGGVDTGKTTLARSLLRAAAEAGLRGALLDTDVGQSTVGPPTTIGLRYVTRSDELDDPFWADARYFVGDVSPRGRFLPLVAGTALLAAQARADADLVVVDTSGLITGMAGQTLKFHKLELLRPEHVVGLQHREELEPVLQTAQRFTDAHVVRAPVHHDAVTTSDEARTDNRTAQLARYFSAPLTRFRVEPTAFAPRLPAPFDPAQLHGMLAGLDDAGTCLGLGIVEHDEDGLALVAPAVNGTSRPRSVRLGAVRVEEGWRTRRVDLRALLGGFSASGR